MDDTEEAVEPERKVFVMTITGYFEKVLTCMKCGITADDVATAKSHYLQNVGRYYREGGINGREAKAHDFRWESQL